MDRDDRCPARTVSRSKDGRLEFAAGAVFSASLALPTADGKNAKPSGVPSTTEVVQLLIFGCQVSGVGQHRRDLPLDSNQRIHVVS